MNILRYFYTHSKTTHPSCVYTPTTVDRGLHSFIHATTHTRIYVHTSSLWPLDYLYYCSGSEPWTHRVGTHQMHRSLFRIVLWMCPTGYYSQLLVLAARPPKCIHPCIYIDRILESSPRNALSHTVGVCGWVACT